ncbi:putative MSHA biogenesis protein MshF [Vibrio nigripulchritudo MADA3029]|uniref:hypothetical protein n=1 Tax=Vibrio nigripulchritudo TaxID=28173 RepID=UPI0003B1A764|nr:hypothetical protein [Vibrio nigripulchritudo]CCN49040.1 putative MSHA biogenesis protein MshF [Vibrio nigripulchritudo MADA3020]CCN52678.1 putative MSHA biogenesis protein MshF [Vibrio nigripulchritudo MADA3021]CCN61038.1 putative MSHA biogenesis protein MshF [Vibrio nigripulchritudo MADA3029]
MAAKTVSAFSVWAALVFILLGILVVNWQKIDDEAASTTFLMIEDNITERANAYRQQWVIKKQPKVIEYQGQQIQLDHNGWVLPLHGNTVDCSWWLETLYPSVDSTYLGRPKATMVSGAPSYHCRYEFSSDLVLDLVLNEKNLSISAIK